MVVPPLQTPLACLVLHLGLPRVTRVLTCRARPGLVPAGTNRTRQQVGWWISSVGGRGIGIGGRVRGIDLLLTHLAPP